jgi:alpha-amylase
MLKVSIIFALLLLFACATNKKITETNMSTSTDWIMHTNVYEVNLRQYTKEGTFNAFAKELPRLKDMGVETLWFMPITPIAQKNKKGSLGSYYAASDYISINPEFGTLADFKNLVIEAHQQGFKLIIDWVANHTGWDHIWTKEHPEYYKKDADGNLKIASGMDDIIELDFANPELRKAMIDAMRFWITEAGIDGFRCDLAFWVELDFWIEARKELEKEKKLFWLGELDPLEKPEYMQVFDAAYTWTWMHRTEEFYKKSLPLSELESVLQRYDTIPGMKAWFTSNHDENSWNGTEYEKYGEAAKALAVFSCTWPGLPLVYSGQELPNQKRLQFFEKDPIVWSGNNELHEFYRTLLKLHSNNPALNGNIQIAPVQRLQTSAPDKVLAYLRSNGEHMVLTLLNLSKDNIDVQINDKLNGELTEVFFKTKNNFTANRNFQMQPWSYFVFEK